MKKYRYIVIVIIVVVISFFINDKITISDANTKVNEEKMLKDIENLGTFMINHESASVTNWKEL